MSTSPLLKIAGSSILVLTIMAISVFSLERAMASRYQHQATKWAQEKGVLEDHIDSVITVTQHLQYINGRLASVTENVNSLGSVALVMVDLSFSAEDRAALELGLNKCYRRCLKAYGIDPYLAPADSVKQAVVALLGDIRTTAHSFGTLRLDLEERIEEAEQGLDAGNRRADQEQSSSSALAKANAELEIKLEAARKSVARLEQTIKDYKGGDGCSGVRLQTENAIKRVVYTKLTQILHQQRTVHKGGRRRAHRELEFERLDDIRSYVDELAEELGIVAKKK